jgi:plasmid stabilization system protein ParE
MKQYKVRITAKAKRNISEIEAYLADEVSSEAASKVKKGLIDAISKLETFPEAYRVL